jgi:uncharacterized SAM-binding protein YcdF (DUF218 family)
MDEPINGMHEIPGIIIVLGSPNDERGALLSIALERCSKALVEYRELPDYAVLPTGGWGKHFNTTDRPHAYYVKQELMARGIPDSAFLPCVESSNTMEDAALARPILERYPGADLIVVTSDFHAVRAQYLFKREYPGRKIRMSTCSTRATKDELAKLQEHERRALERLQRHA